MIFYLLQKKCAYMLNQNNSGKNKFQKSQILYKKNWCKKKYNQGLKISKMFCKMSSLLNVEAGEIPS